MEDRTLYQGENVAWRGAFVDADGNPIDFTLGDREGVLRMSGKSSSSPGFEMSTKDELVWTWYEKPKGTGYWHLNSEQAKQILLGHVRADCIFYDWATNPATVYVVGEAHYRGMLPLAAPLENT